MTPNQIPQALASAPRWVCWSYEKRGGATKPAKVPKRPNGRNASSVDPEHWVSFEEAQRAARDSPDTFDGVGFVLGEGFAGVDLDNVRDPVSGGLTPEAQEIVASLPTYAEVSPSGKGVKVFCYGQTPKGAKESLAAGEIEFYSSGRYFTVTLDKLPDAPNEIADCTAPLADLWSRYVDRQEGPAELSIEDLCWQELLGERDSVEGDSGHNALFRACCLIRRWGLEGDAAWRLIERFNDEKCSPPWSRHELEHKWQDALKAVPASGSEFGVLGKEKRSRGFNLELVEHSEFMGRTFDQRFLVEDVLVANEHFVLGGPKKAMKTSLTVDLLVSIAGGGDFLGRFPVAKAAPVIFLSGESGGATLQKTATRVAAARGVDPTGRLFWGLRLPNLSLPDHLASIEMEIRRLSVEVCMIDPAYLAMLAGSADMASNLFAMGAVLKGFGDIGTATGCTMGLVHHTRKQARGQRFVEPELDDLSQSGFSEWGRQWLLLNHAEKYRDGVASLHMNVGGSAGHSGDYLVRVDTGTPNDPLVDRRWEVTVTDKNGEAEAPPADPTTCEGTDSQRSAKVLAALEAAGEPLTKRQIRDAAKLSGDSVNQAIESLVTSELIVGTSHRTRSGVRETFVLLDPLLR